MTTLSSSTPLPWGTTANVRATGSELNGWLATSGLVQAADAGQVDWTTVNIPAVSSLIGYEIWRFADSSIYFKLEWWTNTSLASTPVFWLTVGQGSDGAGNITGTSFPRTNIQSNVATIGGSSYPTLVSRSPDNDFFGLVWKQGAPASGASAPCGVFFAIEKLVDSSGIASSVGYCVSYNTGTTGAPTVQTKRVIRTASPATVMAATTSFCVIPGGVTNSTNTAGNKQAFLHQQWTPEILLSNFMWTYVASEASFTTTVQATLVGATQHTYIALSGVAGAGNSVSSSGSWGTMMRWE